jgi:hypothetical protein
MIVPITPMDENRRANVTSRSITAAEEEVGSAADHLKSTNVPCAPVFD